jgi:uncharacterized membrane protein YccF (DUF307 family)
MGWFMDQIYRLQCWGNREPILKIRRIIWLLTSGLILLCAYIFAAITLILTIFLAPFAIKVFQLAW